MKLNLLGEITTGIMPFTLTNGPYKVECHVGSKIDTLDNAPEIRWTEHGSKVYLAPGKSYFDFSDCEQVSISKIEN